MPLSASACARTTLHLQNGLPLPIPASHAGDMTTFRSSQLQAWVLKAAALRIIDGHAVPAAERVLWKKLGLTWQVLQAV